MRCRVRTRCEVGEVELDPGGLRSDCVSGADDDRDLLAADMAELHVPLAGRLEVERHPLAGGGLRPPDLGLARSATVHSTPRSITTTRLVFDRTRPRATSAVPGISRWTTRIRERSPKRQRRIMPLTRPSTDGPTSSYTSPARACRARPTE